MAGDLLVTGGTGTVGSRTVAALRTAGIAPRIAARTPHGDDQVRFDYGDASTFQAAFEGIGAVFLVAPSGVADMLTAMRPFLEAAVSGGVERFVLLSAAAIPEGGPLMGAVHAYLHERAPSYAALQPSWFMQNFTGGIPYPTIATENAVISATGDGRVAFVDAVDIAAVAARALRDRELTGGLVITGPRAISYDEAAEEISRAAGRRITHRKLTPGELATTLIGRGMPEPYARGLAAMDVEISRGSEDRTSDVVKRVTGCAPRSFENFAADHASAWQA